MTRFKVKKPYNRWIDELSLREKVFITSGIDGIHLAKKVKNCLPPRSLLVTSVGRNRFLLMNLNTSKPKIIEELRDYVVYDI